MHAAWYDDLAHVDDAPWGGIINQKVLYVSASARAKLL